jgi:uncharacterized membrane-anchored protein
MKLSKTLLILAGGIAPLAWLLCLLVMVTVDRVSVFLVSLVVWLPLGLVIAGLELKRRNR